MPYSIFVPHASDVFTDHLPSGDGLVAHGFVRELSERGHRLHVVAPRIALRDSLPDSVQPHELGGGSVAGIAARLRYMLRVDRLARDLHRREGIDLIHQLNPVTVGMTAFLSRFPAPVVLGPMVPEWPDIGETSGGSRLGGWLSNKTEAFARLIQQLGADALLLSSPAARSEVAVSGARRALIGELQPGIDTEVFVPSSGGEDDEGRLEAPIILFLARLEVRKGVFTLLDAFDRLAPTVPAAQLWIGGGGRDADAVRERARASAHNDRIEVLGVVPRHQVPNLLRRCTVYCLPSHGEPFGMSALEAMACGKPLVVTAAGGLQHLVPADGGRKVQPDDAGALAQALAELLGSAELRDDMGRSNRALVENRFAWRAAGDRLEDIYRQVLRKQGPGEGRRPSGSDPAICSAGP